MIYMENKDHTMDKLDEDVVRILDGWYGEPLSHAEDETNRRKYLYEPLSELVKKWKEKFYGSE